MEELGAKKRQGPAEERDREENAEYQAKRWEEMKKKSISVDAPAKYNLREKCRLWTGATKNGYGVAAYGGATRLVHRVSYMIHQEMEAYGSIPTRNEVGDVLLIRHMCNTRLCIEPTHLALGTSAENGQDIADDQIIRGEKHPRARTTDVIAAQIKLSKPIGLQKNDPAYETQSMRAARFGVPKNLVSVIDCGNAWPYLPFSDGTTSGDQRKKAKTKPSRQKMQGFVWAEKELATVRQKLLDTKFVRVHPTRMHNGVPCREWIRKKNDSGYGVTSVKGFEIGAHVVACIIGNNGVRPDGLYATHQCGFSACVEPEHLKFATHAENMKDKITQKTTTRKLTEEEEEEIRLTYAEGRVTQLELAQRYNISRRTMSVIINHRRKI
jgi:predicted DNA-binding protein (UPF0251 family)